jgi:hypothetical protein
MLLYVMCSGGRLIAFPVCVVSGRSEAAWGRPTQVVLVVVLICVVVRPMCVFTLAWDGSFLVVA